MLQMYIFILLFYNQIKYKVIESLFYTGFKRPSIKLGDDFLKSEEDILIKEDDIIKIEEDIPNKEDDSLKTKDAFPVADRFKPRFGDKTFSKDNSNEEEVKR